MENKKEIILNKHYTLDMGSTPVSIITLAFRPEGVQCEYLNSTPNRKEIISYETFNLNGYKKSSGIIFEVRRVELDIILPFNMTSVALEAYWYDVKQLKYISDETPNGTNDNELRISVDTRFITIEEAQEKIKSILLDIKKQFKLK